MLFKSCFNRFSPSNHLVVTDKRTYAYTVANTVSLCHDVKVAKANNNSVKSTQGRGCVPL